MSGIVHTQTNAHLRSSKVEANAATQTRSRSRVAKPLFDASLHSRPYTAARGAKGRCATRVVYRQSVACEPDIPRSVHLEVE